MCEIERASVLGFVCVSKCLCVCVSVYVCVIEIARVCDIVCVSKCLCVCVCICVCVCDRDSSCV